MSDRKGQQQYSETLAGIKTPIRKVLIAERHQQRLELQHEGAAVLAPRGAFGLETVTHGSRTSAVLSLSRFMLGRLVKSTFLEHRSIHDLLVISTS